MALDFLGPVNKIVNDTAQKALDAELPKKVSGVATTFIDGIFGLATSALEKTVELTKVTPEEPPSP